MEVLQQWLIEQREKRKLTIQQLAQNLNKPISYIQDIEHLMIVPIKGKK